MLDPRPPVSQVKKVMFVFMMEVMDEGPRPRFFPKVTRLAQAPSRRALKKARQQARQKAACPVVAGPPRAAASVGERPPVTVGAAPVALAPEALLVPVAIPIAPGEGVAMVPPPVPPCPQGSPSVIRRFE